MGPRLAGFANRQVALHFLVFVLLLLGRVVSDWRRFPIDGYQDIQLPHVVEFLVFYTVIYCSLALLFHLQGLKAPRVSRYSLLTMAICLYVHFLEYFFYAGGRATSYAPAENFATNLLTGFLATGDAGFWQIMRLVVCGPLVLAILIRYWGPKPSVFAGALALYFWGMLLVHQEVWIFLPEDSARVPSAIIQEGVFSYAGTAYMLLFLAVLSWLLGRPRGGGRSSRSAGREVAVWTASFLLLLVLAPSVFEEASITRLFALSLCLVSLCIFAQVLGSGRDSGDAGTFGWLAAAFGAGLGVVMVIDLWWMAMVTILTLLAVGWISHRLALSATASGVLGGSATALSFYGALALELS